MIHFVFVLLTSFYMSIAFGQTLVKNADVSLSVQDLESDLQRVPAEARTNVFSRPAEVQKI